MKWARRAWCLVAIVPIAWAVLAFDGTANWDGEEVLLYAMLALSFPSSLIGAAGLSQAYAILHASSGLVVKTSRPEMLASWTVFVTLGYVQWFVLVPRLFARLRGLQQARVQERR